MIDIEAAERVLKNRFNKAAEQAERDLEGAMLEALAELRKHFDVESVEEAMGMTVVRFKGRHATCRVDSFDPNREIDDPHYCTAEAFEVLQQFKELTGLVGDYRLTFCLYGRLA